MSRTTPNNPKQSTARPRLQFSNQLDDNTVRIGDAVLGRDLIGVVRYIKFSRSGAKAKVVGLELPDPNGNSDGSIEMPNGERVTHFHTKPNHAIFVPREDIIRKVPSFEILSKMANQHDMMVKLAKDKQEQESNVSKLAEMNDSLSEHMTMLNAQMEQMRREMTTLQDEQQWYRAQLSSQSRNRSDSYGSYTSSEWSGTPRSGVYMSPRRNQRSFSMIEAHSPQRGVQQQPTMMYATQPHVAVQTTHPRSPGAYASAPATPTGVRSPTNQFTFSEIPEYGVVPTHAVMQRMPNGQQMFFPVAGHPSVPPTQMIVQGGMVQQHRQSYPPQVAAQQQMTGGYAFGDIFGSESGHSNRQKKVILKSSQPVLKMKSRSAPSPRSRPHVHPQDSVGSDRRWSFSSRSQSAGDMHLYQFNPASKPSSPLFVNHHSCPSPRKLGAPNSFKIVVTPPTASVLKHSLADEFRFPEDEEVDRVTEVTVLPMHEETKHPIWTRDNRHKVQQARRAIRTPDRSRESAPVVPLPLVTSDMSESFDSGEETGSLSGDGGHGRRSVEQGRRSLSSSSKSAPSVNVSVQIQTMVQPKDDGAAVRRRHDSLHDMPPGLSMSLFGYTNK